MESAKTKYRFFFFWEGTHTNTKTHKLTLSFQDRLQITTFYGMRVSYFRARVWSSSDSIYRQHDQGFGAQGRIWTWCIKHLQYLKKSGNVVSCQVNHCLERSFCIFLGRLNSCHKDTSVKRKDHLWIFGQQRQLQEWGSFKGLYRPRIYAHCMHVKVTSWSSAAYIYNLHLEKHLLAPPGEASCRVVCDESAGPVSSGTPRLWTPGSQVAC